MSESSQSPTVVEDQGTSKKYICAECRQQFQQSNKLESHAAETDHRAYRCTKERACRQTFILRTSWSRHERTHSAKKTHACSRCGKLFHRRDNCRDHERACHRAFRRAGQTAASPLTPRSLEPSVAGLQTPADPAPADFSNSNMLNFLFVPDTTAAGTSALRSLDLPGTDSIPIATGPRSREEWDLPPWDLAYGNDMLMAAVREPSGQRLEEIPDIMEFCALESASTDQHSLRPVDVSLIPIPVIQPQYSHLPTESRQRRRVPYQTFAESHYKLSAPVGAKETPAKESPLSIKQEPAKTSKLARILRGIGWKLKSAFKRLKRR